MSRYIVKFNQASDEFTPEWFIMDTITHLNVDRCDDHQVALELAYDQNICDVFEQEQEIFSEFG